jgi:hypothetical protein
MKLTLTALTVAASLMATPIRMRTGNEGYVLIEE